MEPHNIAWSAPIVISFILNTIYYWSIFVSIPSFQFNVIVHKRDIDGLRASHMN